MCALYPFTIAYLRRNQSKSISFSNDGIGHGGILALI